MAIPWDQVAARLDWLRHWSMDCPLRHNAVDSVQSVAFFESAGGNPSQDTGTDSAPPGGAASELPMRRNDSISNPAISPESLSGERPNLKPRQRLRKSHNWNVSMEAKVIPGSFLFLCVNRSMLSQRLAQIKIGDESSDLRQVTDEVLCERLRKEYRRLRGWRYWISLQTIFYFRIVQACRKNSVG